MNADGFRHFYDYHFAENRKIWEEYITSLTEEQFTQPVSYSHGSVRDQAVHLMNVEEAWFAGLQGIQLSEGPDPTHFADRDSMRSHWDTIDHEMRAYLAGLQDEMLSVKPFPPGEDENLIVWQVLLHVVNHGTDHRVQILRLLNDMGIKTRYQDYIFYVYEHP